MHEHEHTAAVSNRLARAIADGAKIPNVVHKILAFEVMFYKVMLQVRNRKSANRFFTFAPPPFPERSLQTSRDEGILNEIPSDAVAPTPE